MLHWILRRFCSLPPDSVNGLFGSAQQICLGLALKDFIAKEQIIHIYSSYFKSQAVADITVVSTEILF